MAADYTILRSRGDIRDVLTVLREQWEMPFIFPFIGCLTTTLRGHYHYEAVVDKWPGFSVILLRQNQVEKQDLNVHEYFIMGKDQRSVEKMLDTKTVIDWTRPFILKYVRMEYVEMLLKCAERHGGRFQVPTQAPLQMHLHPLRTDIIAKPLPPGLRLGHLLPEHAQLINSLWEYGAGKEMEDQIRHHITHLPTACIYHHGKPVSWCLCHRDGSTGYSYTYPEYRRLGLAVILGFDIQKQLARAGTPIVYGSVSAAEKGATALNITKFKSKRYPDNITFLWYSPSQIPRSKV